MPQVRPSGSQGGVKVKGGERVREMWGWEGVWGRVGERVCGKGVGKMCEKEECKWRIRERKRLGQ